MKIAHFGTFDVDNYGDLLFPHIVEWRMPSVEWMHISPSRNVPKFPDALKSGTPSDVRHHNYSGVVIGGGNILHLRSCPINEYLNLERSAIPSIIIGAASLAAKKRVPFILNGPSIRKFDFGYLEKSLIKIILSSSSYLSFRDDFSFGVGQEISPDVTSLIPDTAFDISRMWAKNDFDVTSLKSSNYIVVHVNKRYGGNIVDAAKSIDKISRNNDDAEVRFLPISPCHGDIEYMQEVAKKIKSQHQMIFDISLKGFASQIANSRAYFGSSMHGYITSLSYGVPGLLILNATPLEKFIGLVNMIQSPSYVICPSWTVASDLSNSPWSMPEQIRIKIYQKLDDHWDKVISIFDVMPKSPTSNVKAFILNRWRLLVLLSQLEINFNNAYINRGLPKYLQFKSKIFKKII